LVIVSFNIHVSHAYVTTGLITEKCNFSFAFFYINLLWNIFLFAKKTLCPREIIFFYLVGFIIGNEKILLAATSALLEFNYIY